MIYSKIIYAFGHETYSMYAFPTKPNEILNKLVLILNNGS